jgi:hypothetical protein
MTGKGEVQGEGAEVQGEGAGAGGGGDPVERGGVEMQKRPRLLS